MLCAAMCALLHPVPAAAAGSADISSSVSALTSPGNAYGPWVYENLDVQMPASGRLGFHFENRRASDRYHPHTAQLLGVDAYVPLSHAWTIYTAAWAGTAAPYPQDRLTLEADAKMGRFVPFAGGSLGTGYGIGATRQLYAGVYYYFGDDYASFRYAPSWSPVLGSTSGYLFSLALGDPGKTTEIVRAGTAGEHDISLVSPVNPTIVGEREFDTSVTLKHWSNATSGYHLDVLYGTLSRARGGRIYSQTGIGAGVFFALP